MLNTGNRCLGCPPGVGPGRRGARIIYEFEIHEREHKPSWQGIDVIALRRNGDGAAAELRRSLPVMLAGIMAEVPKAELRLGMLADGDGMVQVELAASAGEETPELLAELSAALQPVAETAAALMSTGSLTVDWPIGARPRRRLGFSADVALPAQTMSVPWHAATDPEQATDGAAVHVIEELAGLPGQGLRVRLRAAVHGDRPLWEAQLSVVTTGAAPTLRMRAAVRRRFPGLQIADSPTEPGSWLQLGTTDLPEVFAFPVSGSEPVPGTYCGPAASIAVIPDRPGAEGPESGVRIGYARTAGGRPVAVELTERERLRHVHVVGQTGTGKSTALAGLVGELALTDGGALVADPHGHLCDRILAELPDAARDRVWLIRCGDVDNPVPINPLSETDPVQRDIAIADVCATFRYLFDRNDTGIVGPRFNERVSMTLRALASVHGSRASLLDVPFAAGDDAFMERAVKRSGNDRLQTWWRTNARESRSSEHGQVLAWVNSKFDTFASTAAMRGILGSGVNALDFAAAMDDGRIILLDLSKAELGESASRLLGYLYLNQVWHAALRRTEPTRPFTVIVDEAHTLIAGALTNMLAEGRKFGLSVVLAHQFLDQLDADLRPAVDGNVATTLAFRCAVADAAQLHKRFGGLVDPSVLVTLPELNAVCLRAATPGVARPHTVIVDHNSRVVARDGAALARHRDGVLAATHATLVDPHRELTGPATAGASNVKTMPAGPTPPSVRPGRRTSVGQPTADPDAAAAPSKGTSFLDEWLSKRAEIEADGTQEAEDVAAAGR